jgi:hypothetical protein
METIALFSFVCWEFWNAAWMWEGIGKQGEHVADCPRHSN